MLLSYVPVCFASSAATPVCFASSAATHVCFASSAATHVCFASSAATPSLREDIHIGFPKGGLA